MERHDGDKNKFKKQLLSVVVILVFMIPGFLIILQSSSVGSEAVHDNLSSIISFSNDGERTTEWSNWTQTSDIDFNSGSLSNVTVDGMGSDGQLRIVQFGRWVQQNPAKKPSKRYGHGIATVSGDDKVVLFGGTNGVLNGEDNETWIYDYSNNQWYLKNITHGPSPRQALLMVTINNSDKILLYGGFLGKLSTKHLYYSDTWIYNVTTNQWKNQTPTGTPIPVNGFALASVFNTDNVVLFGGFDSSYMVTGDQTWVYNLNTNTWTQKFPSTKPPQRYLHAMAPIFNTNKVLLFGGHNGQNDNRQDTWIYDLSSNTWSEITTNPKPPKMCSHTMAPIWNDDKVLLFGGSNKETWVFDFSDSTWSKKTTSSQPGSVGEMASLDGTKKAVHFGGYNFAATDETWVYDLAMYEPSGVFLSYPHDCGGKTNFKILNWTATIPAGTSLKLQLRSAPTREELFTKIFVGPDGSSDKFYNTAGTTIWSGHNGDAWIQYQAYLDTTDSHETPILHDLKITFNVIPELFLLSINPTTGDIFTKFNFSINYKDLDNDAPEFVRICIDGINYTMDESEVSDTNYIDGKGYWFNTQLSMGDHTYQYFTSDGDGLIYTSVKDLEVDVGPLDHIIITPQEVTLTADEYQIFTAVGYDAVDNIVEIFPFWEVNGGGIIDSHGNFTATTVGTWEVTAHAKRKTATATVSVISGVLDYIQVEPKTAAITTDEFQIFTALGFDADNNPIDITPTWEVSGGGKIDETGNFTANKTGTWTVYANISSITGNASIKVTVGKLSRIIIIPEEPTITTDEFILFKAMGYDADMNKKPIWVNWAVTGGGTIDQAGNFSAADPGEWIVFANASGLSGSTTITVRSGAVDHIVIFPAYSTINVSDVIEFTAKAYDSDNNELEISSIAWDVNGGGTIDQTGKFIGKTVGLWEVSASISSISGTAAVKVLPGKQDDDPKDDDKDKDDDLDGKEGNDTPDEKDEKSDDTALYISIGAGVIVVIVILIILFMIVLKKRTKNEQKQVSAEFKQKPQLKDIVEAGKTCLNCMGAMKYNEQNNYFECPQCGGVILNSVNDRQPITYDQNQSQTEFYEE